jgi:hypothetical protein
VFTSSLYSSPDSVHAKSPYLVLKVEDKSEISFKGSSTLHDFSAKTRSIKAISNKIKFDFNTDARMRFEKLLTSKNLTQFQVIIPIETLKSETSGLDSNMYEALAFQKCPHIEFSLQNYVPLDERQGSEGPAVEVNGFLKIACKQQKISLILQRSFHEGKLHLTGKKDLLMSSFNISPPTFFFGTLATEDKVTVFLDIVLGLETSY